MLFGLVLLSASTIFLCVASNIAMFLAGRVLQGLSAALTWTVGLALVVDTVDQEHVGVAMGWIGAATSLGILIAPLLGGVVYGKGGYYSVFAMCFGLLAVDIVLRLAIIEVKEARKWQNPESATTGDSNLAAVGTTSDAANVETGDGIQVQRQADESAAEKGHNSNKNDNNNTPIESTPAQQPIQGGFKGAWVHLVSLLRRPRLLAALWGTLVHSILQTSFDSTLPLFVEDTFHWDSIGAGLVFLPLVLPQALGPLVGVLGDKYGPKWLASTGFLLAAPFLVCTRFVKEDSMGHKIMLCGLLVGIGIAIVLVFAPLMAEITWSVVGDGSPTAGDGEGYEDRSTAPYALAYGLYNMAFSGGALVGPLLGGFIRDEAGWPTVGWALGLVSGVTAVTQLLWIGEPLGFMKRKRQS